LNKILCLLNFAFFARCVLVIRRRSLLFRLYCMLRFKDCIASIKKSVLINDLKKNAINVLFIFENVVSCDNDVVLTTKLFNRRL